MINKILFLLMMNSFTLLHAQDKLVVEGNLGNFYVVHKVTEKESLSSIGRLYGYTPKQLAQYNGLNTSGILPLGASIKVQLTAQNLHQQAENELSIPVYHLASKGDNLFKLSQLYNKVAVASLRNWNDLKTDLVKDGQAIIVGYINGNKPVVPARIFVNDPLLSQSIASKPIPVKPVDAGPPPLKNPNVMDAAVDGARELKGIMKPLTDNELLLLAQVQEKIKKDAATASTLQTALPGSISPVPLEEQRISDEDIFYTPTLNDEGYFSAFYTNADKSYTEISKMGDAAIFKSMSGVKDRKYYVLMNQILPGTIVKIKFNKKSICARVLGELPEIKGAENILLRMSSAAASALGIQNQSIFSINLTYLQ